MDVGEKNAAHKFERGVMAATFGLPCRGRKQHENSIELAKHRTCMYMLRKGGVCARCANKICCLGWESTCIVDQVRLGVNVLLLRVVLDTYPFKGNVEAQETGRHCNRAEQYLLVRRVLYGTVLYVGSAYLVASRERVRVRVRVRLTDDGGGASESFREPAAGLAAD